MAQKKVLIVGTGLMGAGIAQVCAQSGYKVLITDQSEDIVKRAISNIEKTLSKYVEKGKLEAQKKDEILSNIQGTSDLKEARDVGISIEAVFEVMEVKKKIFADLDEAINPGAILGSNTSGLPITEIASATKRPEKVIGIHFFNPAPVMELVEIIRGYLTSDDTYNATAEFVKTVGKTPVCVKDCPGFVTVRVMMPMVIEAINALQDGIASVEDIDTAMRLGFNNRMGPLEMADLIGLDTCLDVCEGLYKGYGDPKFFPPHLLRKMVMAGHLGMKSGKGFYTYPRK